MSDNMTLAELREKLGDTVLNCYTINGKRLSSYDDDEGIITNFDEFVVESEAASCITKWQDCLRYIRSKGLVDDFIHCYVDEVVRPNVTSGNGVDISARAMHRDYIDYVAQDAIDFFLWLWR